MDLSTTYLGFKLRTPLMASASTLGDDVDQVRRMAEAGASAVVLPSLFEEQIDRDHRELEHHLSFGVESTPEALSYFPAPHDLKSGPDLYLQHLQAVKRAVDIPIFASLNGKSTGGWTGFARQLEEAGADALELNLYFVAADPDLPPRDVENTYLEALAAVRSAVHIPVAVKLSPFFSNLANMARRLSDVGARGLVLFNRFYQPDINLDTLTVEPRVLFSTAQDLRLPLCWIGLLHGRVGADLAASGGVHTAQDAVKLLMAGARVTQLCSALFKNGVGFFRALENDLRTFLEEREYHSLAELQGSLSQINAPDPGAFERAHYVKAIHSQRFF